MSPKYFAWVSSCLSSIFPDKKFVHISPESPVASSACGDKVHFRGLKQFPLCLSFADIRKLKIVFAITQWASRYNWHEASIYYS
jgi:hypothetical protein